ncbi:MAG: diacylglycerol kinase family lipid kinase [Calditrichaeota bacterium]|nr:diacylglycerol kinase family lipid kinase [Calditrichota bacterium]
MKKYAVILNPAAGRGKVKNQEGIIFDLLKKEIGDFDIFRTEFPGHGQDISRKICSDYSVIVAIGGDGTMHETVNGMIGGTAALAAVPAGSGNDFIKMLNLPRDLKDIIHVIQEDKRKKIDIGKVGEIYFPNGLGIGFDAWVVRESQKIKKLRGFSIYLYAVLKTVFSYPNSSIIFSADGVTEMKDIFLIAVGNGRAMGGGFFLTPDALIDDGKFDVCIIHALSKREVFLNLPKAITGAHVTMPQVKMIRTDKLEIRSEEGIAVHADGELLGMNLKNLDISIMPQALEVVCRP